MNTDISLLILIWYLSSNSLGMSILGGGTALAIAGRGCVVLAIDKRVGILGGGQMLSVGKTRRIFKAQNNLLLGFTGVQAHIDDVIEEVDKDIHNRKLDLGRDSQNPMLMTPQSLSFLVSNILYSSRRYKCEPIIAGIDRNGRPFIARQDSLGAQTSHSFVACGSAKDSLTGVCESFFRPNMSPVELEKTAVKCMTVALDRDCESGYGIIIYKIYKNKVTEKHIKTRMD